MIRTHTEVRHVVRCDKCGSQHRTAFDGFGTPGRAREAAALSGWMKASNPDWDWNRPAEEQFLDICPRCVPEPFRWARRPRFRWLETS